MLEKLKPHYPILLLTAGHGAVDSYLGILAAVAPGLAASMGVPLGDIVMLIGASTFLNNISQPLVGWIMGHRNLAWTLWFSVLLSSLSLWMGYVPNFFWLAVVIVLGALGTGLYHPEAALSASDATGEKAYLGVPLFMAGGAAIYAAITPVSIRITERYGFRALAWLLVPGLIVAALLFVSHQKKKRAHPSIVRRPRSHRVTRVGAANMSFWPLLAVGFCFAVGSGLFLSTLSSHYELLFGPQARWWSGWTLMALGVSSSLVAFAWSALGKKYGFYLVTLITQAAAVPLFYLMSRPSSPEWGFALALPLSLVTPATVHPMAVTLARNAAGLTQSLRTGLMMGATYAMASVAIMAAGVLLRRGVPSRWIVLFVACCSLTAALLSAWQLLARRRELAIDN